MLPSSRRRLRTGQHDAKMAPHASPAPQPHRSMEQDASQDPEPHRPIQSLRAYWAREDGLPNQDR